MFRSTERHAYAGAWGEQAMDVDCEGAKFPKTVKCNECNARVPIDEAEGEHLPPKGNDDD